MRDILHRLIWFLGQETANDLFKLVTRRKMAEGTYEYECSRAELLGIAPPKYEDWQESERVKRENEQAEEMRVSPNIPYSHSHKPYTDSLPFSITQELDIQEEKLTQNTGKMDEINNILSMTQLRLNKFKVHDMDTHLMVQQLQQITQFPPRFSLLQKACGSLTNLLKIRGGAEGDDPQLADGEGVSNIVSSAAESASDNVDDQSSVDGAATSIQHLKESSTDMQQKMSSQINKLDTLLSKAENAQYSMAHQNKQMKSYLAK